jgi:4-hydroxybenzoate polyprenyltransferase|tara:strand:- start:20 stop:853 length:834 start_codon:yes stop_codon:yes gene_type:complete
MKQLYYLFRVNHYIKNLLVFAPLLFTSGLSDLSKLALSFKAFIIFSLIASVVYVINDLFDIKFDKKHPQKRKLKPLASGKISISFAYFSIAILSIISIFILLNNKNLINVFLIYIIMNVFYSFFLKFIPILDIFILSFNYILRVYAGSVIIDVPLSNWMAITIFAGAIFISALKRRQEIIIHGTSSRPVLKKYSINYLNKIADYSAILSIVFYCLYVISVNEKLVITIPLVLFGILRYSYLSESKNFSDSPIDEIIKDKQNLILVIIWLILILLFNS